MYELSKKNYSTWIKKIFSSNDYLSQIKINKIRLHAKILLKK
jgi:hypothetical protein